MHTSPLLAVFVGGEILDMVSNTGAVAKLVLLTLLIFSLISWAIILTKWRLLRRARVQSGRFVRAFRKAQRLQDIAAVAEQFRPSPLVGVFEGGYEEYKRQATAAGLAAAIPAVVAYNLIGASIREFAARSDDFTLEVLNAVEHVQTIQTQTAEMRR